ncbi:SGNH/GDSL hydrolase family protein [Alicyclobacillus vulcanalis]|uniref:Acyl-CoA thioesterase-1 n=1 Tax=Alicyclobacillus vulcanalis TaxID=252246 RepID=A0A1N7N2W0_9BACL|nr:SGNH/GDSL hydrolase family protein [Alicyclobacillus vulcanalis]SIS92672.1 acyl-CoA thioesterase-1 [Alicyclobacillus vulcanalis]
MQRRWRIGFLAASLIASVLYVPASLTAQAAANPPASASPQKSSAPTEPSDASMGGNVTDSGAAPNPIHVPAGAPSAAGSSSNDANSALNGPSAPVDNRVVRVLVIGSSVARGWKDPKGGGYLHRTFAALSTLTPITYDVIDKAEPGKGVLSIRDTYVGWLETYRPQLVCIAWGGLDDLYQHTPMSVYDEQVRWQIQEALAHHALVMLVTTPVSKASYTSYRASQQALMESEIQVADSFHSPNVYVFNLFDQMKAYLRAHHESVQPLMHDSWHPNARGHALAAELLVKDMLAKFPVTAPVFKAEPSASQGHAQSDKPSGNAAS